MTANRRFAAVATLPLLLLTWTACRPCSESHEPEAPPRDGVFVHVSHGVNDPHRVLMALRMAELMASDRDVLVYFDIDGVQVVLNDTPDLEMAPFPSSHTQLGGLPAQGVTLMVCPGCLQAAGHTPEDVRDGVRVADKETFFGFTRGRILTLDY